MKKIFLIIFLLISGKISAQVSPPVTPPVSPIKLTTVEFDFEPSTNKYFIWNGSTYKWWNPVSSTQLVSILSGYYPQPVGTTDQYIRGDGSLATLPGAATITGSNGITKVGNDMQLSGVLTQNTVIYGLGSGNNDFTIANVAGYPGDPYSRAFAVGKKTIGFALIKASISQSLEIGIGTTPIYIDTTKKALWVGYRKTTSGSDSISMLVINRDSMLVYDTENKKGLVYHDDYSAKQILDSNAIPSVKAVKQLIPGGGSGGTVVNSFNTRTGNVISQSSDYSAYYGTLSQQNTNVSNIATNATNISNEITRATAAEVSNYTAIGVKQPRIIASLPTQTTTRPLIGDSVTTAFSKLILRGDSISAAINLITPATVTYTSGTGVSNNFTNVSIQNSFIEGIWRDGIEYQVITSGSPVGNNALVNTTTGVVTFQDNINSGEYIKVRYRGIAGISTISGVGQIIFVSSYAAMSAQASGSQQKLFIVQSDEVFFAGLPAIYTYYNGNLSRGVVQQIIN